MTYTQLALVAVVASCALDWIAFRTRLLRRRAFWTSYAIMLAFELVVDGVLAGLPVVRYRPRDILGPRLFYAPVEDLLFGFSLVLVTLSSWVWLGRRASARAAQELTRPPTPTRTRSEPRTASRPEKTS